MDDPEALTALLDHAQDAIAVVDERGTYRYVNAAVERLLGYAPSELVGRDVLECTHPEDRKRVSERFHALVAADERRTETVEHRHRTADGGWAWLESRICNRTDTDLGGCVVSSRDVTDRKRAERRRRETETRLRQLAANTEDVLWMFSTDWEELLFVNDAYEEIWGGSVETLREDPLAFLEGVHPEDRARVRAAMERLSAGEAAEIEYRINPDRGYRRWVWVKGHPVFEDGEVTRVVGFSRDVTNRRRRERQLQVMDDLLRHNLRNDMNVILGHAETARGRDGPDVAADMDAILETGERLLETVEKERAVIDVLVGIDDTERIDLADVVPEVAASLRASYPAATGRTVTTGAAEVIALPEIRRALEELLENAAEHAREAPEIEVRPRPFEEHVEIEVRDNAPPIPGNEFEPLFQGNESSDLYHGTGLGLWLVYWIVDRSNGDIEFRRLDDRGNVVAISLPRPRPRSRSRSGGE